MIYFSQLYNSHFLGFQRDYSYARQILLRVVRKRAFVLSHPFALIRFFAFLSTLILQLAEYPYN